MQNVFVEGVWQKERYVAKNGQEAETGYGQDQ